MFENYCIDRKNNKKKIFFIFLVFFIFLLNSQYSHSLPKNFTIFPQTDKDFVGLPAYCTAKLRPPNQEFQDMWKAKIGWQCFDHIHHYCAGIHTANFAYKVVDKKGKRQLYGQAVYQFNYVIERCNTTFPLYPEFYVNKGKMLGKLGKLVKAVESFEKAISLNRSYLLPYKEMSNMYRDINQLDSALEVIERGLRVKPKSKSLKRKKSRLEKKMAASKK